ncbi:MAG: hypothetical protein AB1394_02685 [Bacteroidota bacterium]
MTLQKMLLIIYVVVSAFYLNACRCPCNKMESGTIKGFITVIGNEPFTNLALKTKDGKFYILKSSKELNAELNKQQGSYYLIHYGEKRTEENNDVLIVEKAIPIKNNSN